jgi:hypothetical protein
VNEWERRRKHDVRQVGKRGHPAAHARDRRLVIRLDVLARQRALHGERRVLHQQRDVRSAAILETTVVFWFDCYVSIRMAYLQKLAIVVDGVNQDVAHVLGVEIARQNHLAIVHQSGRMVRLLFE